MSEEEVPLSQRDQLAMAVAQGAGRVNDYALRDEKTGEEHRPKSCNRLQSTARFAAIDLDNRPRNLQGTATLDRTAMPLYRSQF
jgi:hypothetical protein